jgi:hypothetical protein
VRHAAWLTAYEGAYEGEDAAPVDDAGVLPRADGMVELRYEVRR